MTHKTILIADDDFALVDALAMRCKILGLDVRAAHNARDALNLAHECRPDLICLDVNMPCGNGLGVCEMLASDERCSSTPVIIMTGEADNETIRRCYSLCAYYVEKCSDVWPRIEPLVCDLLDIKKAPVQQPAVIRSGASQGQTEVDRPLAPHFPPHEPSASDAAENCGLLDVVFEMLGANPKLLEGEEENQARPSEPPWVLCIDDDDDYSMALKLRLESHGVAVVRAFEGMEGFRCAFTRPADVILLDFELPNGQGDYILRRLKSNPVTKDLPVIVITGRKDRTLERKMIALGAAKFMNKPPNFAELLDELRRHIDVLPSRCETCP